MTSVGSFGLSLQFEESMTPHLYSHQIRLLIHELWTLHQPLQLLHGSIAHLRKKMISWTQCSDLALTKTLRLNSLYESQFLSPWGFPYPKIILPTLMDRWVPPQQQAPQFCYFWAAGCYHSAVKQLSHMSICLAPWFSAGLSPNMNS